MIAEPDILTPDVWASKPAGDLVAVDFETFYTSSYSVKEMGHWAYCHDPRFHAYLVAVTDGERTCVSPTLRIRAGWEKSFCHNPLAMRRHARC